jgi:adenylate dimethylallyltransferase (cytokinin synthase)
MRARMEGTVASKGKVVVVMGEMVTGKSKLAVNLTLCFGGEVVYSDKIQVHDSLDLVTNKVTSKEHCSLRHYLIDGLS